MFDVAKEFISEVVSEQFEGKVRSDVHNRILPTRIVFLEPITPTVMQCLFKPLTIIRVPLTLRWLLKL